MCSFSRKVSNGGEGQSGTKLTLSPIGAVKDHTLNSYEQENQIHRFYRSPELSDPVQLDRMNASETRATTHRDRTDTFFFGKSGATVRSTLTRERLG